MTADTDTDADIDAAARPFARSLPVLLVVGGLLGFAAAFALTYERIQLLLDPGHETSCTFGVVLNCASVMTTPQGAVFGFPNPLIGIAGFAIVVTIGMAAFAGARFDRWFWLGLQAGTVFGIGFVAWLFYQSVFVINRLCPYCMVVWAVTLPLFWYTTLHNLDRGHLPVPERSRWVVDLLVRNHAYLLGLFVFVPVVLLLFGFRSYMGL